MSHDATPDFGLLADYLADELSAEERREVERLIERSSLWREALLTLQGGWPAASRAVTLPFDGTAIETVVLSRVTSDTRPAPRPRGHTRSWRPIVMSAAALTVVAAGIVALRWERSETPRTSARTYATAAGQRATIVLENGSRATLGPSTTLSVTTGSASEGTTVTLTGEALFTVTHDRRTPFTVRTTNAVTRVLGTTFLVRQYEGDRVARVVVAEGRVSLQTPHDTPRPPVVLVANALGVVDDSGHVRVLPNVNPDDYTAWASGKLVFRMTPAREIAVELGRAYGTTIRLPDSALAAQTLTWTVPLTRLTLADAMESFAAALGAHVVQSDSVLTLVPGPASPKSSRPSRPSLSPEKQYGR